MRFWSAIPLACASVLAGCGGHPLAPATDATKPSATFAPAEPGKTGVSSKPIVTPDARPTGKVVKVNLTGRFVVLNFPLGRMPMLEQHLNLYRNGLKVGEVRVSGPQQEDDIVADLVAGESQIGDVASDQ
jgi:uncharacterized lipoprotein YajG